MEIGLRNKVYQTLHLSKEPFLMKIKQKTISFRQCHLVVNHYSKSKAISYGKRKRYISAGIDLNQTYDQSNLTKKYPKLLKQPQNLRRK